jgi:hypothetical protein
MTIINEGLIRQVFDEMVRNKPALQKFLVGDEDDEQADHRILADQIIRNFPWPIGVELRRLFSASMRQLDRLRLDQIFKTIERTMQFTCFVMISQLWKEVTNSKIIIPDPFKNDFTNRFSLLSMGNYSWLIRSIGNMFSDQNVEWFMPEMKDNFDKKFYAALDFWVPERNEIGHYQINLTQEDIEKRCVEYEEKLAQILLKISFFTKYKLVSIREIKVKKPKNQKAKFQHVIDLLNSSDSDFKAQELEESRYAESSSVLLLKSIKALDDYLNLSPLIIDTYSEILDNKDKFSIKKDIFLYTKFRENHLMYVGTEVTEKCDLRALSNFGNLVNEFNELLSVISGKAEVAAI